MANETPPISDGLSAPSIEVLLAGNIADDDLLWVVRCAPSELVRLVRAPVEWVAALGGLLDWVYYGTKDPVPVPTLSRDFAMAVRPSGDDSDRIVVQGISGTNALTVRLGGASLAAIVGDPQAFWDEVSADPENPPTLKKKLPVSSIRSIATAYAHFEILDRTHDPDERARRTAKYLAAVALDPKGHAAMLSGLDQEPLVVGGEATKDGVRFEQPAGTSILYANVEGLGEGTKTEGDAVPVETNNCSAIEGDDTEPSYVVINGVVVKRYGGSGISS